MSGDLPSDFIAPPFITRAALHGAIVDQPEGRRFFYFATQELEEYTLNITVRGELVKNGDFPSISDAGMMRFMLEGFGFRRPVIDKISPTVEKVTRGVIDIKGNTITEPMGMFPEQDLDFFLTAVMQPIRR